MKKIGLIFLSLIALLIVYSIFLKLRPLKKTVFYTNDERIEEFIYNNQTYPIVMAGSSLSGAFEVNKQVFDQQYFNMYLPLTGACSSIEVIKRSNKIPKELYIEINHIDRGTDSTLINNTFGQPLYSLKYYLPFLLKKNHLLPNLIDRVKAPHNNTINQQQPPPVLYNELLATTQKEWKQLPDTIRFNKQFTSLKESLKAFSAKGCSIYFYEMPMDSTLNSSALLTYQRNKFINLAATEGYKFIKTDASHTYKTGDGVHLLKDDADSYIKYFQKQVAALHH